VCCVGCGLFVCVWGGVVYDMCGVVRFSVGDVLALVATDS
jgi:hypothetical protein